MNMEKPIIILKKKSEPDMFDSSMKIKVQIEASEFVYSTFFHFFISSGADLLTDTDDRSTFIVNDPTSFVDKLQKLIDK